MNKKQGKYQENINEVKREFKENERKQKAMINTSVIVA